MDTSLAGVSARGRESMSTTSEPSSRAVLIALVVAMGFVLLTRWPVARLVPLESDEFGFLERIREHWFPMHHTLFLTFGRALGTPFDDPYRGLVVLDIAMSSLALTSAWWWLRAIVPARTAAAGTCLLAVAPLFWGYGAMAGNYTAIIAVGAFLLGVAVRGRAQPEPWQPIAAAVVLGLGTGYRQDIGTFWLPVFLVILWQHRWKRAMLGAGVFTLVNLAWLGAMLHDAGGWTRYRAESAEFAYHAGYLNSVWSLGLVDAPLRYAVKLGMALLWTLGPALLLVPRGFVRLRELDAGRLLIWLLPLSIAPALASHLLVHFGVQGYAFHYIPTLLALVVLGVGRARPEIADDPGATGRIAAATPRLILLSAAMAGLFLFYPTDYRHPGWRGNFDLSFARHTRIGLHTPLPESQPSVWRTANSRVAQGTGVARRPAAPRPL